MRTKLLYAVGACTLLLVVASVAITRAVTNEAEVEVRINAQRLEDGRTEFAVQQRVASGEWGERVLPRGRYFPANPEVGRWLNSTPVNLAVLSDERADALSGFEVALELAGQGDSTMTSSLDEGYYLVKLSVQDSTYEYRTSVSADVEVDMFDEDGDRRSWDAFEWNDGKSDVTSVSGDRFDSWVMSVTCREDSLSAGEMEFHVNAEDDESWAITFIRLPQDPYFVCTSVSDS